MNETQGKKFVYVVHDEASEVSPEAWAKIYGQSVTPGDGAERYHKKFVEALEKHALGLEGERRES